MKQITEETLWRLLELVASPDCEINTEILAEALDKLINGDESAKEEGAEMISAEMNKHLPERA